MKNLFSKTHNKIRKKWMVKKNGIKKMKNGSGEEMKIQKMINFEKITFAF